MENSADQNCEVCYKIICSSCGWEPNDVEVSLIQKEELTACPFCGWSPSQSTL